MEFEVSPGFAPHRHAAMKGNQRERVIRSWEGPVPPVTLPLQPDNPPMDGREGGREGHHPCHVCPCRGAPVLQGGAGRGLRSPWWVLGHS